VQITTITAILIDPSACQREVAFLAFRLHRQEARAASTPLGSLRWRTAAGFSSPVAGIWAAVLLSKLVAFAPSLLLV
jgi:hypothetical protein